MHRSPALSRPTNRKFPSPNDRSTRSRSASRAQSKQARQVFHLEHSDSLLPHFDVLRATPYTLLIARKRANRERASLFGGVGAHALINFRIALKNDFEDAVLMARRVDHVMNVRRDAIVRIRRGL